MTLLSVQAPPNLELRIRLDRGRSIVGSDPTADVMLPDLPAAALQIVAMGGARFRVDDLESGSSREVGLEEPFGSGRYSFVLRTGAIRAGGGTAILESTGSGARPLELDLGPSGVMTLVPGQSATLGSADGCDVVLAEAHVSGFHCRIGCPAGAERWSVVDLGSTNGTFVQGLRVQQAELPGEGVLTLGSFKLPFRLARTEGGTAAEFHGMVGADPKMRRLFELLPKLARSDEPVLVHGESGSGKELVARAVHAESGRTGAFLALNCGALNPTLVESELFGHVKGAFTGATSDRKGAFESCARGTLFLDEIGELPLDLQPKLLRVLENRAVRPVGATEERPVDVRIVAATHRNLEEAVREGSFREDLFHRLFVLSAVLPPLRERPDDVRLLAERFVASRAGDVTLSEAALDRLTRHTWPGNVRELRNVVIRALVLAEGSIIQPEDLQFSQDAFAGPSVRRTVEQDEGTEKIRMLDALERTGGNRSEAARLLGVSKSTFFDRLRRYAID